MARYVIDGLELAAPALAAGLYVVATPIGNLGDITLRALQVLAAADLVACEDTRISTRLLKRYAIDAQLAPYHEHNARRAGPRLLARIAAGGSVALISDAGTPLVSDPGYRLVREARRLGHPVWTVPGPSAALAALSVSGMATDRFCFEGFLPPRQTARRARLRALAPADATLVLYESPNRLVATLRDIAAIFGDAHEACVCREMTKRHEETALGPVAALADRFAAAPVRGEVVVLVAAPAMKPEVDVDRVLSRLMAEMSLSRAAAAAVEITGLPRGELYRRALALAAGRTRPPGGEAGDKGEGG